MSINWKYQKIPKIPKTFHVKFPKFPQTFQPLVSAQSDGLLKQQQNFGLKLVF